MYAYILISLADKEEIKVLEEFQDMPEVEEAHILFGEWDLILKLKIDSAEDVGKFVIEKVRSNPAVELSSTMIVAK